MCDNFDSPATAILAYYCYWLLSLFPVGAKKILNCEKNVVRYILLTDRPRRLPEATQPLDCQITTCKLQVVTDMIFVKSFTKAYFLVSRNLPEENA